MLLIFFVLGVEGLGIVKFPDFSGRLGPKPFSAEHRSAALPAADILPWIACFGRVLECDEFVDSARGYKSGWALRLWRIVESA